MPYCPFLLAGSLHTVDPKAPGLFAIIRGKLEGLAACSENCELNIGGHCSFRYQGLIPFQTLQPKK